MKINPFGLLLLTLLSACDQPSESPPSIRPALVMVVEEKAEATNMILIGEIRSRYESNQGFRLPGKIIQRTVNTGEKVKKGQLLAKLDSVDANLNTTAALADVNAAEASLALANAELSRYQRLSAKNFVSASALDVKEAEQKSAQSRLAQAQAKAKLSVKQTQYTQLTADRDGVITQIQAEPGQVVQAGEAIAQIADTQALEILVAVPESRIAEVSLNQSVSFRLWSKPQKIFSGTVREIAPAANTATRLFNIRIAIKDADNAIKLGETARVKFSPTDTQQNSGIIVPNAALTEINGKTSVWIIDANNKAQPREVVSAAFNENGTLITDGLQNGEKIAIAGVHTLTKDQPVKPMLGERHE